ncbi:acyltransferase [Undibacterium sp. Jales W-56]|uniref:acyltransferase family protein n=1 Tax=Undibacterium sp. Jales W-56 TaxID=2897325 RepID=UPI0021D1ABD7|nr:acyltransferase [Undibacterium sp. Jales W-56]MCU6434123.1 acyltransferase [Undibacterium sp. Jales W-56]
MNKQYSLYLDIVRFLASVFVVLDHFNGQQIVNHAVGRFIPEFGREAVIIFFVLSGYVIAYTTETKQQSLRDYAVARCARIYSVALPLLLTAFLLNYVCSTYFSNSTSAYYEVSKAYLYIPFHMLFLGELWNLSEVPPWLIPYWSLSYEVWYYIFFATLYYFSSYKRLCLSALVFLVLGHKLWLLLPVWMSGVFLYHRQDKFPLSVFSARLGWMTTLVIFGIFEYFDLDKPLITLGETIWPFKSLMLGSASRYLADYVVCIMVLSNFWCARYAQFAVLEKFSASIRAISSYTFTLYLAHMLVISMWLRFYRHDANNMIDIISVSVLIGLFTYLIGSVTEHKKSWFAHGFDSLWGQLASVFSKPALPDRQKP